MLTVLLILAIGASCALVFTSRVELLRLAVLLALWAAVVAAFVSVIYRRQSDSDQAKVRDLKHVYDLQLDREISARREYELSVETHLRRELSAELRAQQADEVAALRAELAALRTNLEILFDTDLAHRPALETDRSRPSKPGRVASSRITSVREERDEHRYPEPAESPIIDVPEEPLIQQPRRPEDGYRGSHRRPSEETGWIPPVRPGPPPPQAAPAPRPKPKPVQPQPKTQERPPARPTPAASSPTAAPRPAPPPPPQQAPRPAPASSQPSPSPEPSVTPQPSVAPQPSPEPERRGRHSGSGGDAVGPEIPRGRHSAPPAPDSAEPASSASPPPADESDQPSRHRGPDSGDSDSGQSVADLLARLQAGTTGSGGRRRRRED